MRDSVSFRRLIPRALLALGVLLALAGCSTDRDVLIRIGPRVVTVDDFKAAARGNEAQYLGSPESAKAELFDDLLRRELLLREAETRGMFKDSAVTEVHGLAEDQALRRALAAQLAPKRIGVSDDEVKQLMAWQDTASHMLVIYTPTRATAEAARREIDGGAPFISVADKFNPLGILPGGGDLGWGTPGSLVAPLDFYLRTAPVGKVIGPVEAPGEGWFVVQVVAREPRPQPIVAGRDVMVREQIRQRKQRLASLEMFTALQREYHFEREPEAAATLYRRIHPPAADQLKGLGGDVPIAPGDPKDPTRILARYEDGRGHPVDYTMGEAVQDWEHSDQLPDPSNTAAIDYWITQQCMNRVMVLEARRRHLDEDPALRRQLEQGANNTILQAIYQSDVVAEADLIPGTIEDFYATVSDNFQRLESVTMESAMLSDSTQAVMLVMHGGHAADLAAAMAMFHHTGTVERRTVTFPTKDPMWQPLETTFLMVPAGQMGGPIATRGGWMVYRVISKQQAAIPLAQLAPGQRQLVQARFDERRRDEALHRVTDHLMKTLKPELHLERLKRIPWPVDSPAGLGG